MYFHSFKMEFSKVTRILLVSFFYWYQLNVTEVQGQGNTIGTPQSLPLSTNMNGQGQTMVQPGMQPAVQQLMQPGMQPAVPSGVPPGMQPAVQSGLQPGMQLEMQPGVQPQTIMANPPMQSTPIAQPMPTASVPGSYPYPTVTGIPYNNVNIPNYPPSAQWSNSPIPGLANPYQHSQQMPLNSAANGWPSYQNQPMYAPNLGYQGYTPYSPAEAAGKLYTNAQYETLLQNPLIGPQLQNIIHALYEKQYPNRLGIDHGKGTTVIQTQETNPIKKKFDAVMNLFRTFTNKGTWAPLTGDLPVVNDAVNIGSNIMDSGLNLIHRVGSSALNPGTTTVTRYQ